MVECMFFLFLVFPFQMARDREDNDSAELSNKNFSTLKSMSGSGKIFSILLRKISLALDS